MVPRGAMASTWKEGRRGHELWGLAPAGKPAQWPPLASYPGLGALGIRPGPRCFLTCKTEQGAPPRRVRGGLGSPARASLQSC